MSSVTSVILSFNPLLKSDLKIISNKLKEYTDSQECGEFTYIDNQNLGGNRVFTSHLYMGAFNYLISEEFVEFIRSFNLISIEYYSFNNMQVFIKAEHDDMWSLYSFEDFNKKDFRLSL